MATTIADGLAALYLAEKAIKRAEAALDAAKEHKRQLEQIELPRLFDEAEAGEFETPDGIKGKRTLIATGSLPKIDPKADLETRLAQKSARDAAVKWLDQNGYGPLIKCTVEAEYDKGDAEKAREVYNRLRGDNSAVVSLTEDIHPMTLQSQMRKRIEEGKDVPMELLGISVVSGVKLTKRPKETI